METIGQRIYARRSEKQWTLPRLAQEAGVAKGYLSELENDKAGKPSASTLFKIATALGTTVADLLGEETRPSAPVEIPESLRAFAEQANLTDDDVRMLAGIQYRGERPQTKEDWAFILESIRRSVRRRATHALKHSRSRQLWRSREALELAEVTGIPDPIEAMRARVTALLAKCEQSGPPTDLNLLASFQGILRTETGPMKEAGRLIPTPNGLVIQTNEEDPLPRRNFTIAHEIGHTLMPTYAMHPVFRSETNVGSHRRNDEEEYLCDIAASAILYPDAWFRPRALLRGPSLRSIVELADEFHGSLEATALAWTRLELWPVATVIWEECLKPTETHQLAQASLPGLDPQRPEPKFRVSRFFRSTGFPYFLPRFKSVDDDSVIAHAAVAGVARGTLKIPFAGKAIAVDCQAEFSPYKLNGRLVRRVISLLSQ